MLTIVAQIQPKIIIKILDVSFKLDMLQDVVLRNQIRSLCHFHSSCTVMLSVVTHTHKPPDTQARGTISSTIYAEG